MIDSLFGGGLGSLSRLFLLPLRLVLIEPEVGQVDSLQAVRISATLLAESDQGGPLDEEFSHEQLKRTAVCIARVVKHVQVVDFWELEHLEGLLERFDLIVTQVEIFQLGKLRQLIFKDLDLVSAQV